MRRAFSAATRIVTTRRCYPDARPVFQCRGSTLQLDVAYTDSAGATVSKHYSITLARFIKHFALAGAGFTPRAKLLARGLGAVAWYWDFVEPVALGADHFGEPIPILRDPTLKAHFSNLAGRAFADFLGREIEKSWLTLSYEGALIDSGLPVDGERPDLLAVSPSRVVAVEAKGYAKKSVSTAEMQLHKEQASQGVLLRHSWAASVAYDLYGDVKVKYLDPTDERLPPNPESTRGQLDRYLAEVEAAAEQLGGMSTEVNDRQFVVVPLPQVVRGRVPIDADQLDVLSRVSLLIERGTASARDNLAQSAVAPGGGREPAPQPIMVDTETTFIDADGIGISTAG